MGLEFWADVSAVWLSFLCFIGLIIAVAASIYAVKGMHAVVDRTPKLMRQAQGYSRMARTQVESASHRVRDPMVQAHSQSRRFTTIASRLLGRPPSLGKEEEKK